ncbi:hypothetical protein E6W39_37150 [Kitasatospora acidiphila]|uniref:Secreted protein n=1 Tax=Kitasatospora acidiphila TaxID=2567942 RepID=A0A540WCX2_9ACTN|nr:hypothetical protein [Kitasatospora acidiphila]TQF06792.1 hypothetical protein E6W39_37150 [Kitasatospora acidiphila]
MLAVTSLAVGVAASLAAPSAHAAESIGDGTTPNFAGSHLLPLQLDELLGHHQQAAGGQQPTTSTTGNLLPGLG